MRIGMVFYDMQEFGGLEEYAASLALALKEERHAVSVFSCAWIPPDNQYLLRLKEQKIPLIQPPKWISLPASDWTTKEKIVRFLLLLMTPLVILLSPGVMLARRKPWREAWISSRNWLQGRVGKLVNPDRRQPITKLMLTFWTWLWRPDVLHLQGYTTNLLYVIEWAYRRKLPVVYEEHQTPDSMFNWWQNFQQSINKATLVVAVSEKSAQALKEVCQVIKPIKVRNPLLVDPLPVQHSSNGNKPEEINVFTVTTVARLYETKGLNYLLEAAAWVKKKYPHTVFRVYGDGPLRNELLELASRLGLEGEEIFVGAFRHQDLPQIMAQTDLFLLPSILEGQPLALVEAMAYGCPIVATSVGGIPELIQDGVNGFLCPPGDPGCLAEKIIRMIENPGLRKKLGQSARKSYEEGPFQPASVSRQLLEIYTQAIELHKGK